MFQKDILHRSCVETFLGQQLAIEAKRYLFCSFRNSIIIKNHKIFFIFGQLQVSPRIFQSTLHGHAQTCSTHQGKTLTEANKRYQETRFQTDNTTNTYRKGTQIKSTSPIEVRAKNSHELGLGYPTVERGAALDYNLNLKKDYEDLILWIIVT